jgi:hypothetical protein
MILEKPTTILFRLTNRCRRIRIRAPRGCLGPLERPLLRQEVRKRYPELVCKHAQVVRLRTPLLAFPSGLFRVAVQRGRRPALELNSVEPSLSPRGAVSPKPSLRAAVELLAWSVLVEPVTLYTRALIWSILESWEHLFLLNDVVSVTDLIDHWGRICTYLPRDNPRLAQYGLAAGELRRLHRLTFRDSSTNIVVEQQPEIIPFPINLEPRTMKAQLAYFSTDRTNYHVVGNFAADIGLTAEQFDPRERYPTGNTFAADIYDADHWAFGAEDRERFVSDLCDRQILRPTGVHSYNLSEDQIDRLEEAGIFVATRVTIEWIERIVRKPRVFLTPAA